MEFNRRNTILGFSAILPLFALDKAFAQSIGLEDILKAATKSKTTNGTSSSGLLGLPTGVTSTEGNAGIKEALANGATAAILRLGKADGYWQDGKVRIPLPKPFSQIQKQLQPLGMASSLDDLQLKMNRAAETAAPKAKTIFVNAIKGLSIEDVAGIIRGGDTAGTDLLKSKTKPALLSEFRPPMLSAVNSSGAAKSLTSASSKYGTQISALGGLKNFGAANDVSSSSKGDLTSQFVDFACSKALDGLFYYIGQEESAIRKDPVKQTSSLLKKVFGGL